MTEPRRHRGLPNASRYRIDRGRLVKVVDPSAVSHDLVLEFRRIRLDDCAEVERMSPPPHVAPGRAPQHLHVILAPPDGTAHIMVTGIGSLLSMQVSVHDGSAMRTESLIAECVRLVELVQIDDTGPEHILDQIAERVADANSAWWAQQHRELTVQAEAFVVRPDASTPEVLFQVFQWRTDLARILVCATAAGDDSSMNALQTRTAESSALVQIMQAASLLRFQLDIRRLDEDRRRQEELAVQREKLTVLEQEKRDSKINILVFSIGFPAFWIGLASAPVLDSAGVSNGPVFWWILLGSLVLGLLISFAFNFKHRGNRDGI